MEKVVVTGMGTVNPLGLSVSESWEAAIHGRSGVGPITLFDASDLEVQIACEVKGFQAENYMSAKEARRRDRFQQFAAVAAQEALRVLHQQVHLVAASQRARESPDAVAAGSPP